MAFELRQKGRSRLSRLDATLRHRDSGLPRTEIRSERYPCHTTPLLRRTRVRSASTTNRIWRPQSGGANSGGRPGSAVRPEGLCASRAAPPGRCCPSTACSLLGECCGVCGAAAAVAACVVWSRGCLPGRASLRLAAAAALAAPRWAGSSWAGLSDCRTGLGWLGGLGTGGEAPAERRSKD